MAAKRISEYKHHYWDSIRIDKGIQFWFILVRFSNCRVIWKILHGYHVKSSVKIVLNLIVVYVLKKNHPWKTMLIQIEAEFSNLSDIVDKFHGGGWN